MENEQEYSELNDQQLDKLSRHIVRASQATDDVVEAAAASPFLYQKLRARMEAENVTRYQKRGWRAHLMPFLGAFSGFRLTLAATTAALLLISVGAIRWYHKASPIDVAVNQPPITSGTVAGVASGGEKQSGVPEQSAESRLHGDGVEDGKPALPTVKASLRKPSSASQTGATEEEVVSDFMPLTYSGSSSEEGGQIVRVEMPRAALLALGLPVNAEITGEKLKADVLLGGDGVALAIRFVQ